MTRVIRMNTTARGADFNADAGQLAEVDDARAQALIDGGYAEPAEVVLEREDLERFAAEDAAAPPAAKRERATAAKRSTR